MRLLALFAALLALPASAATEGTAAAGETAGATTPFVPPPSDERMEFRVSYLGLTVGKARLFSGKVDRSVAPVFLQAQTASVASIITVKEQLSSYIDPGTGLPLSGSLESLEGDYRHSDSVHFDRSANRATVRERGSQDETWTFDVPAGTVDFVALVYRLRHLSLAPGTKYRFHVLAGRNLRTVVAEVLGRESLETGVGTVQAVKVLVPTGFEGFFVEKQPTYVWFSDDERRMIARLSTDFAIGHATANLVSYVPGTRAASAPVEAAAEASSSATGASP